MTESDRFTAEGIDRNIIDVTVYKIDSKTNLHVYTGLWCAPCKRIKPKLIETMEKHSYRIIEQKTMQKVDFKKDINEFVPFFVVEKIGEIPCCYRECDYDVYCTDFRKVDSIQTSDEILFKQFLSRNDIRTIDDSLYIPIVRALPPRDDGVVNEDKDF